MKTLKKFLFIAACISLLTTCSKPDEFIGDDLSGNDLKCAKLDPKTVKVSFKAKFSVWDKSDYTDISCGGYPVFFLTMEGHGTTTHLGHITTKMTFCCNVITGEYYNTIGSFVAANGDQLFFEIPVGKIIPNDEDNSAYYQTKFNDPMIFTGGTGRFKGATGSGSTNAYVHDGTDEWRTDFFSTATLTLVKGKQ